MSRKSIEQLITEWREIEQSGPSADGEDAKRDEYLKLRPYLRDGPMREEQGTQGTLVLFIL